jgi:hypothetical protein
MKRKLSNRFLNNPQISNFTKIRPVAADLFEADGKTTKTVKVAIRNVANAPKNDRDWPSGLK